MRRLFCHLVFVAAALTTLDAADIKIITVRHYSRVPSEGANVNAVPPEDWTRTEIGYVHGPVRRFEYEEPASSRIGARSAPSHLAVIEDCATRVVTTLDLNAREYMVKQYPDEASDRAAAGERERRSANDLASLKMAVETEATDTGETMPLFGHTAHRFVITSEETPLGEAVAMIGRREDVTVDAWYLDVALSAPERGCGPGDVPAAHSQWMQAQLREEKRTGPKPTGFPVKMKRVAHITSQRPPTDYIDTLEITVTEMSHDALDPSLFAVPAGFKKVTQLGK